MTHPSFRTLLTVAWSALVVFSLSLTACQSANFSTSPELSARATKLIGDLNDTPETAQLARAQLLELGEPVAPYLLAEAKAWRQSDVHALRAARSLRLLGEMDSIAATGLVQTLLTDIRPQEHEIESYQRVLLSEAVRYATSQMENATVRKALFTFIASRKDAWRLPSVYLYGLSGWNVGEVGEKYTQYTKSGWNLARDYDEDAAGRVWTEYQRIPQAWSVWVDVYAPLKELVNLKTPGTVQLLSAILRDLPSTCGVSWEFLHADGYHPWKVLYSPVANDGMDSSIALAQALGVDEAQAVELMQYSRPRLVVLDWLMQLQAGQDAAAGIEALLTSPQADERAKALEAIETLGLNANASK